MTDAGMNHRLDDQSLGINGPIALARFLTQIVCDFLTHIKGVLLGHF